MKRIRISVLLAVVVMTLITLGAARAEHSRSAWRMETAYAPYDWTQNDDFSTKA
jgi:hypothetical protein